jgi:hypothetical protein
MIRIKRRWVRRLSVVGVLAAMLFGSTIFAAEVSRKDWQFSKLIELQGSGKYHELLLDEDVYKGAKEDLGDLRIVDDQGQFVPFYIDSGYREASDKLVVYRSDLIDTIKKSNDSINDFRITPLDAAKDILGNRLSFSLPAQPFLKHLEIYGSYDGNQWELLKKDDVYRTEQLEKNTVVLDSEYKFGFYRIKVLDNVENLAFPQLQLLYNRRESGWKQLTKAASLPYEIKQENGQTAITIDNDSRLRITKVLLETGGSFTRSYTVQEPDGKEIQVEGKPELYRLDFKDAQLQNTTITGVAPIAKSRFLIKINNRDNPPLNLTGVKIEYIVDKLVFENQGGRDNYLLYGNGSADKPNYDIAGFRQHIEQEHPLLASLGMQTAAPEAAPAAARTPLWFQPKTWFNIVIVTVSVLLIIMVVRKLGQAKDQ